MSKPAKAPGVYVTFAALCALVIGLVALLARSSGGVEPVRGVPPFSLDEPPPSQAPDASRTVR